MTDSSIFSSLWAEIKHYGDLIVATVFLSIVILVFIKHQGTMYYQQRSLSLLDQQATILEHQRTLLTQAEVKEPPKPAAEAALPAVPEKTTHQYESQQPPMKQVLVIKKQDIPNPLSDAADPTVPADPTERYVI